MTTWLPVPGFSRYQVSNEGEVLNLRTQRRLTPQPNRGGYLEVKLLSDYGRRVWWKLHSLVLEVFVGPRPSPRHHAAHGPDRNPRNNRLENLRWATPEENEADKKEHGTKKGGGHKEPTPSQRIHWIKRRNQRGESLTQIASVYNMHRSSVARILSGARHNSSRKKMKTIDQMQDEHKVWADYNFGDKRWPLLGLMEEAGELAHAILKRAQNIRGTAEEHDAEEKDAIADITIFLTDHCTQQGLRLSQLVGVSTFPTRQVYPNNEGIEDFPKLLFKAITTIAHSPANGAGVLPLVIALSDRCHHQGWDYHQIVESTWEKVSKRDFKKNQRTGVVST